MELTIESKIHVGDYELGKLEEGRKLFEENKALIKAIEGFMKLYVDRYDFNSTNLKLYDIAWQIDKLVNKYIDNEYYHDEVEYMNLFQWFCEDHYDYTFLEYLEENNLQTNHIGRTSSFFFELKNDDELNGILDMINTSKRHGSRIEWEDVEASSDYKYIWSGFTTDKTMIEMLKMYIQEISGMYDFNMDSAIEGLLNSIEELNEILHETLEEVKELDEKLQKIKCAYDWLQDFKDNQVEYFIEFLENRNE